MRLWTRLFFAIALMLSAHSASAQSVMERLVSPGPLASAHARLEATCDSCHISFTRTAQNNRCLACHRGIASDVSTHQGFHGRSTARTQECRTCHSDHHGRGFALVRFTRATFNHALTDYPLVGGHARATCAGCHGTSTHFRTTPTACASCHVRDEPHRGRLGRNCQSCHTVTAWATTLPFNHANTGFALTGAHRSARCMTCHIGQRWAGTPTTCISCHARDDRHNGTRGTNCSSCHSTATWAAASFNHARDANFPLLGQHATTACAGCHGTNNAIRNPARTCIGCHTRDDTHHGSRGTSCANCHNPSAWTNTRFDHSQTAFPLLGKHAATACAGCHGVNNATPKPETTCIACHAEDDAHQGQNGPECARCHTVRNWDVANFNHDEMTRFPLTGAHRPLECGACHTPPAQPTRIAMTCVSCHAEDDAHAGRLGTDCASCHGAVAWAGQVRFDHALTRFPLIGKHAGVLCAGCHVDKQFTSRGITCQSCHEDTHHAGTLGTPSSCSRCHNSTDWRAWRFDHDSATSFPLTGRHQGLICSACHSRPGNPADAPTTCIGCHRRDDRHRGGFGNDCARCHVTTSFSEILM